MAGLYEAFAAGRANGAERKAKKTLSDFMMPATRGDQNALSQVYSVDPNAGMQAEKMSRQTQEDDLGGMAKAANFYLQTKDPKAYSYIRERMVRLKPETAGMPEVLATPEDQAGAEQFMRAIADAYGGGAVGNNVQSTYINDKGQRVAIMRDGSQKLLGAAEQRLQLRDQPGIAPGAFDPRTGTIRPVTESQSGPLVEDGMPVSIDPSLPPEVQAEIRASIAAKGSVPDAISPSSSGIAAARPAISPAEQIRLRLAEEASARAQEAADRQRAGNIPTGFRLKADGSGIEPIPGGPKPAGAAASEDERKAAGWYMQANKAFDDMEAAMAKDPAADDPGILETYVPVDELANRSRSPARQQYAQASSAFGEAVLRAATGAGVNRDEAAQKIRELTPQRGDTDAVKIQKRESLKNYLQALQARAGRALSQAKPQAKQTDAARRKALLDKY